MGESRIKELIKTVIYVTFALVVQGWQIAGVIVIAVALNRPWELSCMLIGFWIGRYFFGKTYHAESLWACTLISWAVFYFMLSAVPSFSVSITLPAIYGVGLAYALTYVKDYVDRLESERVDDS